MGQLAIRPGEPSEGELGALRDCCRAAFDRLKSAESEAKLPIFIEFAGSPKSGKSTIIGIIAHFLKRQKIRVAQPVEGASMRTPEGLKDDWLAFNAWSGCYALQNILIDSFLDPPTDVVLLDRGLFDIAGWMEFLASDAEGRIVDDDKCRVVDFFTLDLWRRRENLVFLFTCDHKTSILRETDSKLTPEKGSVMNEATLGALLAAYKRAAANLSAEFPHLYQVDTSLGKDTRADFQMIAFHVAEKIVELFEELGTQELLVTESIEFEGFNVEAGFRGKMCDRILRQGKPLFIERQEAEKSRTCVQVVPYALIKNRQGLYFRARRRADLKRKELQKRLTILVGGHAEKRDWDPDEPSRLFETCLRRELDEELVGIRVEAVKLLGFIYDPHTPVGFHHLACVHEVQVGGKLGIRRQAIDKEFGREAVEWVNEEAIRQCVEELDPWSQRVAHKLFGAQLPQSGQLFQRSSD